MLKKINQLKTCEKEKIEKIIQEALETDHIHSYPLEDVKDILEYFPEYAKVNDLVVTLRAEYSNIHQGVLVQILKKSLIAEFEKYL
jgi:hypothetical protein